MPLTTLPLQEPEQLPGALDRLNQHARDLMLHGDPFIRREIIGPTDDTSLTEAWGAAAGLTLFQAAANLPARPTGERDEFNPYTFINETPHLRDNPTVALMVELGAFDFSYTPEQFNYDRIAAEQFVKDMQTLNSASNGIMIASMGGAMFGDPTNLIPLGWAFRAAKLAKTANTGLRVAKYAGIFAGIGLATEKIQNWLQPLSNEPGLTNEAIAAGVSAAFGASIGLLTSPSVKGPLLRGISNRKLKQLRTDFDRMVTEPVVRRFDPDNVQNVDDLPKWALDDEIEHGRQHLQNALDEAPADNRTVSALHVDGDENTALIGRLLVKYEKADKTLHVVDHPDQPYFELSIDMGKILAHPSMNVDAAPSDFDFGFVDAALSHVTTRYANLQAKVTPGGRVAQTTVARLADVYRTLSGSAQTVSKGSAIDPLNFEASVPAESIKGVYEGMKDNALLALRKTYAQGRKTPDPITYNGQTIGKRFSYGEYRRAVGDYFRHRRAVQQGFQESMPTDVHPLIVQGAEHVRQYLLKMGDEALGVRLLSELDRGKWYLPRVWNTQRLIEEQSIARRKLIENFNRNAGIVEGVRVTPDQRPLIPEVVDLIGVEKLGVETLEDAAKLVEGDLAPDILAAYREQMRAYFERNADAFLDKMAHPHFRHGVNEGLPQDPLKTRVLTIDESEFTDFLETDIEIILERYHRVLGGEIAIRRAIQLNPAIWDSARLKNGNVIDSPEALLDYLNEMVDTMQDFAAFADAEAGRTGRRAVLPAIQRLRQNVTRDIALPMDVLRGRYPFQSENAVVQGLNYFGRNLLRATYLNKLGSIFWAQMNDLAPVTLFMLQRPRTLAIIPRAMFHLKGLPRRDLEVMGLMFDHITRVRALADVDHMNTGMGMGHGQTRRVTAAIERGTIGLSDFHSRLSLMNWITDLNKQTGGALVLDWVTINSKKLLRAASIEDLRRVGLSRFNAGRLNKLGFNKQRSMQYHRRVYDTGLMLDDRPIRDVMSFDAYLKDNRPVKPNMAEWNMDDRVTRDLFDVVAANISSEVHRSLVVTPGVFDRPIINFKIMGRLFNQFQTFGMAFVNQRLRVMGQMPAKYQLWYHMSYLFLGAMSDAISNHLSGRRTFDETAQLWGENPLGMTYAAWERSGLAGWLGRPLAIADAAGIPIAPGVVFDQSVGSAASRHVRFNEPLTFLGPAASDLSRFAKVGAGIGRGELDSRTLFYAWKLAPMQNLLWLRMLYRGFGLPVVPEFLMEHKRRDEPPEI